MLTAEGFEGSRPAPLFYYCIINAGGRIYSSLSGILSRIFAHCSIPTALRARMCLSPVPPRTILDGFRILFYGPCWTSCLVFVQCFPRSVIKSILLKLFLFSHPTPLAPAHSHIAPTTLICTRTPIDTRPRDPNDDDWIKFLLPTRDRDLGSLDTADGCKRGFDAIGVLSTPT